MVINLIGCVLVSSSCNVNQTQKRSNLKHVSAINQHIETNGGKVFIKSPIKEIVTNAEDDTINHFLLKMVRN